MPKSNAQKCKDYRKRQEKAIRVPMPQATHAALADLMEWHEHTDQREAIATMIHRLHELGRDKSRELFAVSQHQYQPSEEMVQRLVVEGSRAQDDWR